MTQPIPGARPAEVHELARVQDRLSFVYMEHCIVNRDSNAITASNQQGTVHVPASMIGALLLGPGTNVTHQAMVLLAESGATTLWVGEQGVRYYAHGRPLARTTRLLQLQAEAVTDRKKRLAVARRMYEMRFPDDVATGLTLQELRGHEGARVRQAYRDAAVKFGVDGLRDGRAVITMEHVNRLTEAAAPDWPFPPDGHPGVHRVVVDGSPGIEINTHVGISGIDHNQGGVIATAARAVNVIEAVCGAPSGLLAVRDLRSADHVRGVMW